MAEFLPNGEGKVRVVVLVQIADVQITGFAHTPDGRLGTLTQIVPVK